jgi:DNA polymerase
MAYAFDEEPVELWGRDDAYIGEIELVFHHVLSGRIVYAHNAAFELAIWNHVMVPRYGWPPLRPEQMRCTMAMCYSMGLPGALEKAAPAMGLEQRKDMAGARVMMQLAKPREMVDGKPVWWDDASKIEALYAYCNNDVEVERALTKRLLPLSDDEQALWVLDQKINGRGILVDRPSVEAAIGLVQTETAKLNAEIRTLTGGVVSGGTDLAQLKAWIKYREVDIGGLAKADVATLLERDDLPADVRRVLVLRQEAGKSSTAKLSAMVERASSDDRIRGTMQYHGASSGRWAGRGIQVQNMPRGKLSPTEVEEAIALFGDRDLLDMMYGAPLDVLSSCLRGMLIAAPGHEFIVCDFSNIEGRLTAWLADEAWKLEAFRAFDAGAGPDLYKLAYARSFGIDAGDVTKDQRQVGKVMELALQYQGGVGAFQTMARGYGVAVEDAKADELKVAWRSAHPAIVAFWHSLERAAIEACLSPAQKIAIFTTNARITFLCRGSFLFCQLPSGRVNVYPFPSIKANQFDRDAVFYWHQNQTTNKWEETSAYGGVFCNHVTQGTARDLLVSAIRNLEAGGFPVVMHVHDEAVCEVPLSSGRTVAQAEHLMCQLPSWALNLPVAAEGWAGRRYRK